MGKRMRRLAVLMLVVVFLTGCWQRRETRYTTTFVDLFDTVTTVVGYAENQDAFDTVAGEIREELTYFHQLFDIYREYPGVTNLKTVNDQAGIAPVVVDAPILTLLQECKRYYTLTDGKVNAAMGTVLQLWHRARTDAMLDPQNAGLPDAVALEEASEHTDFDKVLLDMEKSTVYFADPLLQLDVGAIAKGWATQRVAEQTPAGFLISVGGNVCATGPKTAAGDPWIIAVQDPDGQGNLCTIAVTGGCVVTSGDYQRQYWIEGVSYHHIIDPENGMPARFWRSVTVVCTDSALADVLSTALFVMPLEEGQKLLEHCGAEALWVDADGERYTTDGFEKLLQTK